MTIDVATTVGYVLKLQDFLMRLVKCIFMNVHTGDEKKRFITSDLPVVEVCLVALSHPTPPDCAAENKLPVDFEGCGIRETPGQEMRSTVPGPR